MSSWVERWAHEILDARDEASGDDGSGAKTPDPDLIACPNEHCGRPMFGDELLTECAGSVAHLVILHCPECQAECLHHGWCGDEARREAAEMHGRRT